MFDRLAENPVSFATGVVAATAAVCTAGMFLFYSAREFPRVEPSARFALALWMLVWGAWALSPYLGMVAAAVSASGDVGRAVVLLTALASSGFGVFLAFGCLIATPNDGQSGCALIFLPALQWLVLALTVGIVALVTLFGV